MPTAAVVSRSRLVSPQDSRQRHGGQVALALGALGVVYGDIGTSPLYAVKETFLGEHHPLAVVEVNVMGVISIVLWTLVLLVAVKYISFVLRADNHGEGGILALTALVNREPAMSRRRRRALLILLGLFGTSLLYGDGMITPAISVLSAVEGTELINPWFRHVVVPMAVVILLALFAVQRFGTGGMGKVFGPLMLVWFTALAVFGVGSLVQEPQILGAFNPVWAVRYFEAHPWTSFLSMGSLFLVVTGGEALYADMGHFGRRPITLGWFSLVMPALMLSYLGTGSLLLREPEAVESPLFLQVPGSLRVPMVILATAATVIASQALISGVFSLTMQAIKLGYAPLTRIVNTSHSASGQIYIPMINWALAIACIGLVVVFRSSSALAAAYGLSVTGTMFITTLLFGAFARGEWRWSKAAVGGFVAVALTIEGLFLGANLFKIPEGGWFPLVVAAGVFTMLTTWKTGRTVVARQLRSARIHLAEFAAGLGEGPKVRRSPGTAVFMFSNPGFAPASLLGLMRSTGTVHERVFVVSVITEEIPVVPRARRERHTRLSNGFHQVTLHYGFMEPTPVAADLQLHLGIDPRSTDYFLGRETVQATELPGMARWREVLFVVMKRNATDVGTWFQLPADRVLEIGARIDI
jgi:KUP system potassium uptake protein